MPHMKLYKTQQEIAVVAGVSQSFVSAILRKERTASTKVAKRLEEASGIAFLFWRNPTLFDKSGNPLSPTTPSDTSPELRG